MLKEIETRKSNLSGIQLTLSLKRGPKTYIMDDGSENVIDDIAIIDYQIDTPIDRSYGKFEFAVNDKDWFINEICTPQLPRSIEAGSDPCKELIDHLVSYIEGWLNIQ